MFDDPFVPLPAVWLGDLISTRRRALGCSQRELAGRVCAAAGWATLTRHEISRYERETRLPAAASLPPLADALGLPSPVLRRAVAFSARRRRLAAGHPDGLPCASPGYLFGVAVRGHGASTDACTRDRRFPDRSRNGARRDGGSPSGASACRILTCQEHRSPRANTPRSGPPEADAVDRYGRAKHSRSWRDCRVENLARRSGLRMLFPRISDSGHFQLG
ncbi:MAG: helix-turn-helix transcriptional regulator [Dactylosporangium sp.]|nr:helix-turn-helix domain-containing protein [Dactylosporangium sp.]NNJ61319.1 helix-turn-helix transcriptional regulator [Dactylosporangium sp.]